MKIIYCVVVVSKKLELKFVSGTPRPAAPTLADGSILIFVFPAASAAKPLPVGEYMCAPSAHKSPYIFAPERIVRPTHHFPPVKARDQTSAPLPDQHVSDQQKRALFRRGRDRKVVVSLVVNSRAVRGMNGGIPKRKWLLLRL